MSNQVPKARILIAEDEKNIAAGIAYNLEKRGYEVSHVERGDAALDAAAKQPFDLVILDVMMPGMSGFEVCRELRARKVLTPILMLTARHETENRIKGLRLGADDYLGKPFELGELLARAEALVRRRRWDGDDGKAPVAAFALGPARAVEFDADTLELKGPAGRAQLTAIESRLMHLLVTERGKPIPRARVLKQVWGLHEETQTRTLDNFIMRLRHRLAEVGGAADWIESVRGVGYRFQAEVAPFTNL
jgi:DNA-binding response OmpR family regulator